VPLCWHIFFLIFKFPALIHGVYTEWVTLSIYRPVPLSLPYSCGQELRRNTLPYWRNRIVPIKQKENQDSIEKYLIYEPLGKTFTAICIQVFKGKWYGKINGNQDYHQLVHKTLQDVVALGALGAGNSDCLGSIG
jgi:hypothetical protein